MTGASATAEGWCGRVETRRFYRRPPIEQEDWESFWKRYKRFFSKKHLVSNRKRADGTIQKQWIRGRKLLEVTSKGLPRETPPGHNTHSPCGQLAPQKAGATAEKSVVIFSTGTETGIPPLSGGKSSMRQVISVI